MRELPAPLAAFGAYRQFLLFVAVPSQTRPGKTDKFPCDFRTGAVVSAHDPQFWTDHATAIAAAANFGPPYGVAFAFTEADPFWFLDIDGALNPDGSSWSSMACQLLSYFEGCAVEVSQSGKGLHIFGTGRPPVPHRTKPPAEVKQALKGQCELEFYHADRFVALTGWNAIGNAATDATDKLVSLVDTYFPPGVEHLGEMGWTEGPCEGWRGPVDDDDLIRRALRSNSAAAAFGNRASFADLWNANIEKLCLAYPDDARGYDASSADAALAQHLAFWTGKDCARIERLMRRSNLTRDKWEREDYLPRTILGAVGRQFDVLSDKVVEPPPMMPSQEPTASGVEVAPVVIETPKPTAVTGQTFVNPTEQVEFFKGCVYVRELHRALIPGGIMLKPEQFKVHFGGYTFPLDSANERSTRDAWEAFTQSQSLRCPRADLPCFKPDQEPGAIINRGGQTFVNTFWPVSVPRKVGDASPFLNHLRKVLPNGNDAEILLSYMAACVQHMGVKAQWAPLLQGVEGNGKTLFTRCVAEAVGRRYVHWPKASKLTSQFNGWMLGKTFYAVEDIYVPDSRREVIEELKPMITGGDGLEIEGKGVDQISADICGNFIFNSNHKDAIRKTRNDRRFAVLFCAQQQAEDLARDGMTGDYFPKLYRWLKEEDGYAIVNELLYTYPIPDQFNFATGCQRAPQTSSTEAAIAASVGSIEQEIEEAIAQGLPGFCGDFISSIQLERLLERVGTSRRMSHSKRTEMLDNMGFLPHPSLTDGRVNNLVLPDQGKPKLFVKRGSHAAMITGANEIAKAYETANNHSRVPFPIR